MALGLERGLEPGREGGAGGQAETGGERIPEGDDFERTVGGVRGAGQGRDYHDKHKRKALDQDGRVPI